MDTEKKIGASGWSDESDFPGFYFIFGIDAESSEIQIAHVISWKLFRLSGENREILLSLRLPGAFLWFLL